MARTITVIWSDRHCNGPGDYHIQELELNLTPNEVRDTPSSFFVCQAMVACYGEIHSGGETRALVNEAIKDYNLVGIINGVVEWLH